MTAAERKREDAVYDAKLRLGFGDVQGFRAKPCRVCGSRVSRTYNGVTECFLHFRGPLQMEIQR